MPVKTFTKGEIVSEALLVEKRSDATTKTGKPYLNLTLRDKTGSIQTKLWDYQASTHVGIDEGAVVEVVGVVDEYQGTLQLTIRDIAPSDISPDNFIKSTRFNIDELWTELISVLANMKEPMTQFVATQIVQRNAEAFKQAPAARRVHNNWMGGLLEHVVSLCRSAYPIVGHYQRYNPKLSMDKVLFGLILHDAGKIVEYDFSKPSYNFTPEGVLTNHMVLGPVWVYEECNRYEKKNGPTSDFAMERAHLMHVLAAHHGKEEWGSPVKPSTLEAILVHHLDNLDSKMLHAIDLIEGKPGPIAGFSERSFFENTQFMVPK